MSAPTLFVLAADLTKMQVLASLDESDVGRIRPGQAVRFRVDAFPTEEFTGSVTQVRLQPTTVQNVVTYQTVIDVPNPGLKLKPGMTANVNIEIARRNNVLRVPNAALRFRPTAEIFAALGQTPPPGGAGGGGADAAPAAAPTHATRAAGDQRPQRSSRRRSSNRPLHSGPRRSSAQPAQTAQQGEAPQAAPTGATASAPQMGRGEGGGGGRRGGRGNFAERMASMTPEERERFMERMRARGFTPPADGQTAAAAPAHAEAEVRDRASRRQAQAAQPAAAARDAASGGDDVRRAVRPADADRDHSGRSG